MIKLLTVIGARPQIIKAAALSRAVSGSFSRQITEVILHTGQHYDTNMSQVFFDELGIPSPSYNLNTGSGPHGRQTAAMIAGIEEVLEKEKPQAIVLYGDTNSTLAGAVAAGKLLVPVVHIEAGLRSFNKTMPEELNRILCDHSSTLLFCPTPTAYRNLLREGFRENQMPPFTADRPGIFHCGDVMYDNSLFFSEVALQRTTVLQRLQLSPGKFALSTIHRNNNTDDPVRLNALFRALLRISGESDLEVVLPLHPRTDKMLEKNLAPDLIARVRGKESRLRIIPPVSFLEMIALERSCALVLTDSGGVQKEAFFFKKPCVILRPETEWVELVECGAARIADANEERIVGAFRLLYRNEGISYPDFYGDGKAAEFICARIAEAFS